MLSENPSIYHLPLTLETPAANLALDEALLEAAEAGELPGEILRIWESPQPLVVLGRSSPASEINWPACRREGVPVLRRVSGGQTVVVGPGCLMYALVLDSERQPELRGVDRVHQHVLSKLATAVEKFSPHVRRAGTSDLTLDEFSDRPPLKFSGNSLRVRRRWLLYHGTLLYDFPIASLDRWLGSPARIPAYRAGRSHADFVTNLPAARDSLVAALLAAWNAVDTIAEPPLALVDRLVAEKYFTPEFAPSSSSI